MELDTGAPSQTEVTVTEVAEVVETPVEEKKETAKERKAREKAAKVVEAEEVTDTELAALKADYVLIGDVKAHGVIHKKGTPIPNDSPMFEFFNTNGFLVKK